MKREHVNRVEDEKGTLTEQKMQREHVNLAEDERNVNREENAKGTC